MRAKRSKVKQAKPAAGGPDAAETAAADAAPRAAAETAAAGRRRGGFRAAASAPVIGIMIAALVFIGGFAVFFAKTMRISLPPAEQNADAIIVLTGGRARLETGFTLLREGRGQRLLISGVSPIMRGRRNVAKILGADPALLECCVDLGWEALNTSGNAAESAAWAAGRGYSRLLVVTNRYHMLRALAELRHTMPGAQLIPYPVDQGGGLFQPRENFRLFASEYVKFLVVSARNIL